MNTKGILFDNDGTLVDTYELILSSFHYATRTVLGRSFPDEYFMRNVGKPLADQMPDFTDDPALQQELVAVYREHNHAHHDQEISLFEGVACGLERLHQAGIALGVVTAKMHALAWRGLEIAGAAPYLSCLVGPDDCPKSKPDPDPVLLGMELLGVDAQHCLYVGDSPFDIRAGNAAGCATVAVLWGMFAEDVLRAENPTYVISSFEELESIAGMC